MAQTPLIQAEVDRIREEYRAYRSIRKVRAVTGYNARTIMRYIRDLVPNKITDDVIINVFRATGGVERTAEVVGVHPRTVKRACDRQGVTHTEGAADSKKLYQSLRGKVAKSGWKGRVLTRDNRRCVRCHRKATVVHHVYRLAAMRDDVFQETRYQINPYRSRRELMEFLDLVMAKHTLEVGESLCKKCHDAEHYDD